MVTLISVCRTCAALQRSSSTLIYMYLKIEEDKEFLSLISEKLECWTSKRVLLLIPLSQGLTTLPDIFRKGIMEQTLPCVFYCPPA